MIHMDGSPLLPSSDSFQLHVPSASTPKRPNKSCHLQPLSSTLSMSSDSHAHFELSISAITISQQSPVLSFQRQYQSYRYRRNSHLNPSTIIKRIELKYLLYSTRTMNYKKQRPYVDAEMKIYLV